MTKEPIVLISYLQKRAKNVGGKRKKMTVAELFGFKERRTSFSLESWEIRPSEVFGARSKAALHIEANAWTPDLRSFDSPYLGFTLCLRAMLMFRLVEALNGRLIGSKS